MNGKKINKEEFQRMKEDLGDLERHVIELSSFLPLAVCSINPPKIIIDINRAFQDLTGYSSLSIIGEPIEKIFLEKKEIDSLLNMVQKEEKAITREMTLISEEKKEIPVSVSVSTRKDVGGNFIGHFLALSNITEIKKFREELSKKVRERTKELEDSRRALMNILEDIEESRQSTEEEKDKTLAIITNLSDGLLVFDKENKLSLINPRAEDFFAVKSEEILGKPLLELSQTPHLFSLVNLLGKESNVIFRKELFLRENLILEISTTPMIRGEERLGFLVVIHDITREKIIERMKTEFVSISAHQLRTPLSAIKWTLRMLLDGDVGDITQEQRELIEKTYANNERMIALINDLLDVTRIEEGRHLYRPVLVDIESVIQFAINSYKGEIERKKLRIEFYKPEKKLPKVMIDVEKIRLAIQNILDNAIRYTPPEGKVTVSFKRVKKEIEVSIRDTGVGIPKNQQDRVFTKFFRGANVIRMETEGTGLGLFITKNIIESHEGRIWFESKENKGTTFYFTIPLKEEFEEFLKEF